MPSPARGTTLASGTLTLGLKQVHASHHVALQRELRVWFCTRCGKRSSAHKARGYIQGLAQTCPGRPNRAGQMVLSRMRKGVALW